MMAMKLTSSSPEQAPRKLNLGCGKKTFVGFANVDLPGNQVADLHWDLRETPWPFAEGTINEIAAHDVLEHLPDTISFMNEALRVSEVGGIVHITTPHVTCLNAFKDPTHLKAFTWGTFDFFVDGEFGKELKKGYEIQSRKIFFYPSFLNKIIWRLANWFPETYEKRWAWMFPAWFLEIRLKVVSA